MTDDKHEPKSEDAIPGDLPRRNFVVSVTAGLVAAGSASGADLPVVETDVEIKTPDGTCDAAFIHPKTGSHPGVLIWPDAFGLRPSMRDMAKRLAAEGYSVLVPNPFYRVAKAPFTDASNFNFQNPADMAKLTAADGVGERARQRREGCGRLRRLPRRAERSEQVEEDRHPGLLHGRTAGGEDRRGAAQSHRRGRVVPRRRAWSPTNPTARICSRRRSRLVCISASPRMTTRASRTPKTS